MSKASLVPETGEALGAEQARAVVAELHWGRLLRRSFARLRAADGFSHARASAFAIALLLVEGTIAILGLAVALGSSAFSRTITAVAEAAVPGPAGSLMTSAARQAQETGSSHQYAALLIGLTAALITGTTAMGQFERSCNRIYGVEEDRPSVKKYTRAFVLALTVGLVSTVAITMMVLGRPIAEAIEDSSASMLWTVGRWPLAVGLLVCATTALLKYSPRRRQPSWTWLIYGAALAVGLMVVASIALAVFFRWSTTFGDTYGPLAGMIGLLLWCLAISAAGLYGIAITAQLEAEHSKGAELTGDSAPTILTR